MEEGSKILKLVQEKLAQKDEIIHEQQRQITDLSDRLSRAELHAAVLHEAVTEKDQVIRELMAQIEGSGVPASSGSQGPTAEEHEQIVREQMQQIIELTERVEFLEGKLTEFNAMQSQLKDLLGG